MASAKKELLYRARWAIERRATVCYDVCAETGQMFDNVKHMRWFVRAVAEAIRRPL